MMLINSSRFPVTPPNILLAPRDLSNAAWTKKSVLITTDAASGNDGSLTADKMYAALGNTDHYVEQVITKDALAINYVLKAYVKAVEISEAQLGVYSGASDAYQDFDISSGTKLGIMGQHGSITAISSQINAVANGYFELVIIMTIPSSMVSMNPFVQLVSTGQVYNFNNDGAGYYVAEVILNSL